MRAQVLEALPLRRRIGVLVGLKALSLLLGGLLLVSLVWHRQDAIARVIALVACLTAGVAFRAWELSQRRQFVREARLPTFLGPKLRAQYPQLTDRDVDLVLHGLRQFFMAYVRGGHQFVAMPSKVVDEAWHAFILHTRGYENWCAAAFGKLLHHTPAEVLGRDPKRNDGLRRTWYWACKEESIDPSKPTRLPLLFALDKKLGIAGGFSYVPDCHDINRQSGSGAHCGTSFGEDGGFASDGSADSFGGCETSSDGGDGGSGCGGD